MTITLKEFNKFATENDILWFYNKPRWGIVYGNWHEAIFGTPAEREKEREKLLNKKKELQMCKSADKTALHKHATIIGLTNNLDIAVDTLERLMNDVDGIPSDQPQKKVDENVSLASFLAEHPKIIEQLTEKISLLTGKLREMLF